MSSKIIVHDLEEYQINQIIHSIPEGITVIHAKDIKYHCIGCFGCWIKTPGKCVLIDEITKLPALFAKNEQVILISENLYGGFSPKIKRVLDRCIGYILPFFRLVNGEMHHVRRYQNSFSFCVHFYGTIDAEEKEIAKQLVKANGINLNANNTSVHFYSSWEEIQGVQL